MFIFTRTLVTYARIIFLDKVSGGIRSVEDLMYF